jgi:carbonic anhydrase/acetyltransferase-like protein (isoleucine patch superfamily)
VTGSNVWICQDLTIISGTTIGDECIIDSNSLVRGDIPPYSISVGIPAKHLQYRFDEKAITSLLNISWWNLPDEYVHNLIPLLCNDNVEEFVSAAGLIRS